MRGISDQSGSVKAEWLGTLHEILLCLNVVFAAGYVLLTYALSYPGIIHVLHDAADYHFKRTAIRLNLLMGLPFGNRIGPELTFLLSVSLAALFLILLLRAVRVSRSYAFILNYVLGAMAIFAFPAALLFRAKMTWDTEFFQRPVPFWKSLGPHVIAAEVICVLLLLLIRNRWPLSLWTGGFLLLLHYAFWEWYFFVGDVPGFFMFFDSRPFPLLAPALSAVAPLAGLVWLFCFPTTWGIHETLEAPSTFKRRGVVWAVVPLSLLIALWWPPPSYSVSQPKDLNSVTIILRRSACYGLCPVYKVKILGSGLVEYEGDHYVQLRGKQTSSINSSELAKILAGFDQLKFFTLEDRAFQWCFDTPRVAVSLEVDGKKKVVSSDSACTGKSGPQARFVALANEIDDIVGSERWVACPSYHCRY